MSPSSVRENSPSVARALVGKPSDKRNRSIIILIRKIKKHLHKKSRMVTTTMNCKKQQGTGPGTSFLLPSHYPWKLQVLEPMSKQHSTSRSSSQVRVEEDRTYAPLMDYENTYPVLIQRGVTTINFFPADDVSFAMSVQKLRSRLRKICDANPWMAGTIVQDKSRHERLMCSFPNAIQDEDIDAIFSTQPPDDAERISSSSPYQEVATAMKLSGTIYKSGYELVNKPDRVCSVSLFPINGGKEFALVVTVAHAVVDGHTYFKVLNMFAESSTIESLRVERLENFDDVVLGCIGKEDKELLKSGLVIGNLGLRKLFNPPLSRVSANYIDPVKIAKAKQEAKKGQEDPNFFVSTNDIITSALGNAAGCDTLLMTLNLRGRSEQLGDDYAGNYIAIMNYDRESFDTPAKIRQSLSGPLPFKKASGKGPMSRWNQLTTNMSMISSLAFPSFNADIHLWQDDGSPSAPVALHLPLFEASTRLPMPAAFVFKPCKGKLAIMCAYQEENDFHKRLVENGGILGETVNAGMFER